MAAPWTSALNASSLPTRWKRAIATFLMVIMVAIASVFGGSWQRATAQVAPAPYAAAASPSESRVVGNESVSDIPFWIWVVLPRLFPEKLPGAGGYTSLGLSWERGNELPTGFTRKTGGIPRVVLDDPANANFDVQDYTQFLIDCAHDPRFNADFILPEITYNINLSPWEKLVYRLSVIPNTKKALLNSAASD
ncbi:MAG: hypothetical protein VKK04_23630 [Synechococcales bacterium]|nr:hypothetical protein [Synechococcales bacterium]